MSPHILIVTGIVTVVCVAAILTSLYAEIFIHFFD